MIDHNAFINRHITTGGDLNTLRKYVYDNKININEVEPDKGGNLLHLTYEFYLSRTRIAATQGSKEKIKFLLKKKHSDKKNIHQKKSIEDKKSNPSDPLTQTKAYLTWLEEHHISINIPNLYDLNALQRFTLLSLSQLKWNESVISIIHALLRIDQEFDYRNLEPRQEGQFNSTFRPHPPGFIKKLIGFIPTNDPNNVKFFFDNLEIFLNEFHSYLNFNLRDPKGQTALMALADDVNVSDELTNIFLPLFLRWTKDNSLEDNNGETLVYKLFSKRKYNSLTTLFKSIPNLDIDVPTKIEGKTALFLAVEQGQLEWVMKLVHGGADPLHMSTSEVTPLDLSGVLPDLSIKTFLETELNEFNDTAGILKLVWSLNPKRNQIDLSNGRFNQTAIKDSHLHMLIKQLEHRQIHVQSLDLSGNLIGQRSGNEILNYLKKDHYLVNLKLDRNRRINSATLSEISDEIAFNQMLAHAKGKIVYRKWTTLLTMARFFLLSKLTHTTSISGHDDKPSLSFGHRIHILHLYSRQLSIDCVKFNKIITYASTRHTLFQPIKSFFKFMLDNTPTKYEEMIEKMLIRLSHKTINLKDLNHFELTYLVLKRIQSNLNRLNPRHHSGSKNLKIIYEHSKHLITNFNFRPHYGIESELKDLSQLLELYDKLKEICTPVQTQNIIRQDSLPKLALPASPPRPTKRPSDENKGKKTHAKFWSDDKLKDKHALQQKSFSAFLKESSYEFKLEYLSQKSIIVITAHPKSDENKSPDSKQQALASLQKNLNAYSFVPEKNMHSFEGRLEIRGMARLMYSLLNAEFCGKALDKSQTCSL